MDAISTIKQEEEQYMMHTYARFPIAIEKGYGSTLVDVNGKEYIDFGSGIGVNALGYGDADWCKAVADQAVKLPHVSNLYYTTPQINLAKKLVEITHMSKVFFANSGAEANEGAIKLARKYSVDHYGVQRTNIVTLVNSFHGRTITTLKATGQEKFHQYFFPFTEGFVYGKANDITDVLGKMDDTVCAIMMESIQGEGGVLPLDENFVKEVCAYAKEKDILVIFDEIQTGVARTGKFFGFEHYDCAPDIVTMAKGLGGGLPIGAFLCNEKLKDTLSYGQHGTTFGGNLVACAGALVVLEKVATPEFLQEVAKKGQYLKEKIAAIGSPSVGEVKGRGLMLGIEIIGKEPKSVVDQCIENGLIALTAGSNVVRLLPPLVIGYEELDRGIAILSKVL